MATNSVTVFGGQDQIVCRAMTEGGGEVRAVDADGQTIVLSHFKSSTAAASQQTYALADEITVVGAPSLAALVGKQARAAFNADEKVHVIEVLHVGSARSGVFKQAAGGTAAARTGMELDNGSVFSVLPTTQVTVNRLELSIGPGGTWPSVHAFLTDEATGMRPGDLVTATVDPAGNAQSLDILRLSSVDYIVEDARRDVRHDVLTVRQRGSSDTVTVSVAKTAVIDINGRAALFTDLVPGDTVRLALSGEISPAAGAEDSRHALWVSVTR